MNPAPSVTVALLRLLWSFSWELAIVAVFVTTWIAPVTLGEEMVARLIYVMLLEFLIVHATGFFSVIGALGDGADAVAGRRTRALAYLGLFAFYGIIVTGFALGLGSSWPVVAFAMLMLPRFPALVLDPPDFDGQFRVMAQWAAMTALFLFGAFLSIVDGLPTLGITPDVVAAQGFTTGGLWLEEPHRVMVFGVFYFTGQAVMVLIIEGSALRAAIRSAREAAESRANPD